MTPEEAIEGLRYMIDNDCLYTQWNFIDEVELAIEALEQQIPKKPVKNPKTVCGYSCPNCGGSGVTEDYGAPNDHCADCGQAIK